MNYRDTFHSKGAGRTLYQAGLQAIIPKIVLSNPEDKEMPWYIYIYNLN